MISRSEPLRRRNIRRGFHTVCLRGNAYRGAPRRHLRLTPTLLPTAFSFPRSAWRSAPPHSSQPPAPRPPHPELLCIMVRILLVPTLRVGTHTAALRAATLLNPHSAPFSHDFQNPRPPRVNARARIPPIFRFVHIPSADRVHVDVHRFLPHHIDPLDQLGMRPFLPHLMDPVGFVTPPIKVKLPEDSA